MADDDDTPLLSPEERSFLQQVFQAEDPAEELPTGSVRLPLDPLGPDSLARYLMSLGPLHVVADGGGRRLSFPLSIIEETGTGHLGLEFAYPHITEVHPQRDRSLRVRPDPADGLMIVDPHGRLRAPAVVDVSVSGILLQDLPTAMDIGDALPELLLKVDEQVLRFEARVVRRDTAEDRIRYALTLHGDNDAHRALEAYVFRRYRRTEQAVDDDPFSS